MDRVFIHDGERVTPDRILVQEWGYDLYILRNQSLVFTFDGKTIHHDFGLCHSYIYGKIRRPAIDLRYFPEKDVIAVWVDDTVDIVLWLKDFEAAYRKGEWRPFDIESVRIVFSQNGYAVRCGFSELDAIGWMDENQSLRGIHTLRPMLKRMVVSPKWRTEYFREGERSWIMKHGNVDPALYHLIMYEE